MLRGKGASLEVTGASGGAPHPLALLFQLSPNSSRLLCGPLSQIWVLGRQEQRKDIGAGSNATPFYSLFSIEPQNKSRTSDPSSQV